MSTQVNNEGALNSTSQKAAAGTIVSAATITQGTSVAIVSGTAAIATIIPMQNIASGSGTFTLIPSGVFTTVTSGNIALASTAVINKALKMTYDSNSAKWYPSY
jgi:hypothetical protein